MEQETLIYIDEKEKYDASIAANSFANEEIKNRAYINTLGAQIFMKYLKSDNIEVSDIKNLHSIKRILEDIDISDVILSNLHLDVRVVFDENIIFVPKSHFEYNLLPDVYVVLLLEKDLSNVKVLGYFEPQLINKNNYNDNYYFIEKEKLTPITELAKYINNHNNIKDVEPSDDIVEKCEQYIISYSDHDISNTDKKYLLEQLIKSSKLRDIFAEYENFETLSYKLINDPSIEKYEFDAGTEVVDEFALFENNEEISIDDEPVISENIDLNGTEDNTTLSDIASLTAAGLAAGAASNPTVESVSEVADNVLDSLENTEHNVADFDDFSKDTQEHNEYSDENLEEILVDNEDVHHIQEEPVELEQFSKEENYIEPLSELFDEKDASQQTDMVDDIQENIVETFNEDVVSLDEISDIHNDAASSEEEILHDENDADNIISLEDMPEDDVQPLDENEETNPKDNMDDNAISLDEIQEVTVEDELEGVEEVISLDEIPEVLAENEGQEAAEEPVISLEEIPDINADTSFTDNPISLDNIEIHEDINNSLEGNEAIDLDEIEDNFIINEEQNEENTLSDDNDSVETIDKEAFGNTIDENIVNNPEQKDIPNISEEAFGKNLLENLSAEEFDTVDNIESVDNEQSIDSVESSINHQTTSDDLLAQIDDVLNSSGEAISYEKYQETVDNLENSLEELTEDATIADYNQDDISQVSEQADLQAYDEQDNETPDEDKLGLLYSNETIPETELSEIDELENIEVPQPEAVEQDTANNKTKIIALAAVIIAILGAASYMFIKPKNTPSVQEQPITPPIEEQVSENSMETNTPEIKEPTVQSEVKEDIKELKNTAAKQSSAYMSVSKIVWDVPDALSYSKNIQNYLRTAGKSIKLSLSADLLLATEYAYTNQVKIGLVLTKDGSVRESRVISSSGSTQIDNIVLQSVKDTLNVIKPPRDEINTPNFNLNLIIYF